MPTWCLRSDIECRNWMKLRSGQSTALMLVGWNCPQLSGSLTKLFPKTCERTDLHWKNAECTANDELMNYIIWCKKAVRFTLPSKNVLEVLKQKVNRTVETSLRGNGVTVTGRATSCCASATVAGFRPSCADPAPRWMWPCLGIPRWKKRGAVEVCCENEMKMICHLRCEKTGLAKAILLQMDIVTPKNHNNK